MELNYINQYKKSIDVVSPGSFQGLAIELGSCVSETLTYCMSDEFLEIINQNNRISSVIIDKNVYQSFSGGQKLRGNLGVAISDNAREDFFRFHNFLARNTAFYASDSGYVIGKKCSISEKASVSKVNVQIGDSVVIEDFVKICSNVTIGDNTVIRAGSIIGNEGFQFLACEGGILQVDHVGGVCIGKNVEIQSNCCVDRHIFNDVSIIGDETKMDNFVHIGHGSKVGERCRLAAKVMVSGSTAIGNDVFIGPGSSISSLLRIGDNAFVTIGSVVTTNVENGERVSGNFAIGHERFIDHIKSIR